MELELKKDLNLMILYTHGRTEVIRILITVLYIRSVLTPKNTHLQILVYELKHAPKNRLFARGRSEKWNSPSLSCHAGDPQQTHATNGRPSLLPL